MSHYLLHDLCVGYTWTLHFTSIRASFSENLVVSLEAEVYGDIIASFKEGAGRSSTEKQTSPFLPYPGSAWDPLHQNSESSETEISLEGRRMGFLTPVSVISILKSIGVFLLNKSTFFKRKRRKFKVELMNSVEKYLPPPSNCVKAKNECERWTYKTGKWQALKALAHHSSAALASHFSFLDLLLLIPYKEIHNKWTCPF